MNRTVIMTTPDRIQKFLDQLLSNLQNAPALKVHERVLHEILCAYYQDVVASWRSAAATVSENHRYPVSATMTLLKLEQIHFAGLDIPPVCNRILIECANESPVFWQTVQYMDAGGSCLAE